MKQHLHIWKQFLLKEQKESFKLFEDIDGCLAEFQLPVLERVNEVLNNPTRILDPELFSLVQQIKKIVGDRDLVLKDIEMGSTKIFHTFLSKVIEDDVDFWANLPWTSDGKELWNYVSQFDCYILSAPIRGKGKENCIQGKKIWIQKNLNISLDKCFFTSEKYKYAGPQNILIDDYEKNINEWSSHGGISVHHKDSKSTIRKLNKLLYSKR